MIKDNRILPVASFTEEVNLWLAKRLLLFNGRLANHRKAEAHFNLYIRLYRCRNFLLLKQENIFTLKCFYKKPSGAVQ